MQIESAMNGSQGASKGATIAYSKREAARRERALAAVQQAIKDSEDWVRAVTTDSIKELHVWLIRVSPKLLDMHDNLPNAFKRVTDAVAEALGKKDHDPVFGDMTRNETRWNYRQAYGGPKVNEVYIVIERKE